jgi:hypothetical protein
LAHNCHVVLAVQHGGNSLAQQLMIVDGQYPDGSGVLGGAHRVIPAIRRSNGMLAGDGAKDCPPGACLARSYCGAPVGNGRGNPEVYFRCRPRLAPDVQLASQLFGALAHANQAEVPGFAPFFEHRGINTLPIVADSDLQDRVAVDDLGFDIGRFLCIPETRAEPEQASFLGRVADTPTGTVARRRVHRYTGLSLV